MKLIFLLPFLLISCGNPHIASKEPPQLMVSPIKPEDETGSCAEEQRQQQQQQQQQGDFVLIQDDEVLKLKKCKDNEVVLEKSLNKFNWSFDRSKQMWGTRMPFKSKSLLQLRGCKEELLSEFSLTGLEEQIGFSTKAENVCSVSVTRL